MNSKKNKKCNVLVIPKNLLFQVCYDSTPTPVLKCISHLQLSNKCNCTAKVAVKHVDNKYIFVC